MKRFVGSLAFALVALAGLSVQAAEPVANGNLSESNLASLGLGGMTVVSDDEGEKVRGMGNAVSGGSFAWGFHPFTLSFSQNIYNASGNTQSRGGNASFATLGGPAVGGSTFPFPFFGGILSGIGGLAGGGSFASNN